MIDEVLDKALASHAHDKMFHALACDGPRNGEYLTVREAHDNSYTLTQWPEVGHGEGEYVWQHADGNVAEAMITGNVERIR